MAQAAMEAHLDPDRLSFTDGLFQVTEMIDLSLTLQPEKTTNRLAQALAAQDGAARRTRRHLRINRREIKQVYSKYKPKKRHLPPPEPFKSEERFLDFVKLLDPLTPQVLPEAVLK